MINKLVRFILLTVFYVTPLGWIHIINNIVLDCIDFLAPPIITKNKDNKPMNLSEVGALYMLFRAFSGGSRSGGSNDRE